MTNESKTVSNPVISTYFEFVHLKHLFRQGWLKNGLPKERCESVADHSFGVAMLAMLLVDIYFPDLDVQKVLRMALIHDIGEVHTGDIIPKDNIHPEEKHQREEESFHRVFGSLVPFELYRELWNEFEIGTSPEARFLRQVDKLEMALQAGVYQHQNLGDFSDFFTSAQKEISNPELLSILEEIEALS
jgi:putative hydrolase of HD superfamily